MKISGDFRNRQAIKEVKHAAVATMALIRTVGQQATASSILSSPGHCITQLTMHFPCTPIWRQHSRMKLGR